MLVFILIAIVIALPFFLPIVWLFYGVFVIMIIGRIVYRFIFDPEGKYGVYH